jgi:7,8-dihydroneopterin aldolase/epimerase/oxygenase
VVVNRILVRIFKEHQTVHFARVKVAKRNPPIGGDVEEVAVERELSRTSIN